MCARYYIDNSVYDEIEPDVGAIPEEYRITGDIRPSERPCCVIAGTNGLTATNEMAFFLAGCFDVFQKQKRFTIITTAANESMIQVHDRMPLIISPEDARDWLLTEKYKDMLCSDMPMLENKREYEQLTLNL